MIRRAGIAALALALALPGLATAGDAADAAPGPAVRMDGWQGSDSDGNRTRRLALGWDVAHRDQDHWWGLKVERAHFEGDGWSRREDRVYLAGAGDLGGWQWQGEAGSNGHDLIGRASIHSGDPGRREFFVEREVLETRGGVANGWIHTFAGASVDLPMGERFSATLLGGLQDFGTGSNLRTHLRGSLVHAFAPEQGLSLQLRTRYFRDSDPREADYFSPAWHGEAVAALGWRRFVGGYRWQAVAGAGRQRSAGEAWKRARMLQFGFETPRRNNAWLRIDAGWSDSPVVADAGTDNYSYRYLRVQGAVAF